MMTEAASDSPTRGYGKIAGLYDLLETLGSGHFAVVKLARHVFTGAKVAVKVVDKTKLDEVSKAHLFQEVRCMKLVQHPNVVRLYEVIDTQTKLYLVLELGDGGDLYDYIMKHDGGLTEELARKYFRQILRAISYCHQLHVVHRDLKPENVVFFEKLGVVKLTDFGFSNKFSPGQKLETSCGSLAYSAPEILLGESYDAPAVDIWSLGVILYMLVCGNLPFEKENDSETLTMIMDCKFTVPPQISQECHSLIVNMLVRDPNKRATLAEIAEHPWVKKNVEKEPIIDHTPLVSRQQLSEEDHAFIIQKMINGQIASKEEIAQSLDKNKYNHITATYFLLAEIRLRKQREEQAIKQRSQNAADNAQTRPNCGKVLDDNKIKSVEGNKVPMVPIAINITPVPNVMEVTKPDKRSRKCSIVREEDEDESAYENTDGGNELRVAVTRHESISDGRLNRSVQERTGMQVATTAAVPCPPVPIVVQNAHNKMVLSVDAILAQKLNQIENTTTTAGTIPTTTITTTLSTHTSPTFGNKTDSSIMHDTLKGLKELEIGKLRPLPSSGKSGPVLTHRRSKLNKIRTPSCSSSEASDDDTKSRNKKKLNKFCSDTPTRFHMNRRDSYDDSSDSQDQAFSSGSRGHAAANLIAASNSNNKKDGQTQGKDQKHSDDTRKSSHSSHKNKNKQPKDSHLNVIDNNSQSIMAFVNGSVGNLSRRRRVRESQSLDRITEAQEYEMRQKHQYSNSHAIYAKRNSLFNLSSFSLAETKEEYDDIDANADDDNGTKTTTELANNALNLTDTHFNKRNNKHNIYNNINSISELDLLLENRNHSMTTTTSSTTSTTKAIQVAGTKCFVTIKKIRRLGKYFPVVNFS